MRKFIVRILLFLAIMFVVDRLAGSVLDYASWHPKGGMTFRRNYITDYSKDEVLIFGSSRAHYHYNPQIIKDSLGLSCYNCGEDAMGIILFYAWWKLISQRYHPDLVIYEVTPEYDIREMDNNYYLWRLRRYYDRDGISDIFNQVDSKERWKMLSWMYRYNSTFTELAADIVHPLKLGGERGFVGVKRTIKKQHGEGKPLFHGRTIKSDTLKLNMFEKMIQEMGSTQLVLTVSPSFYGVNDTVYASIKEISQKYDIPFLDYSNSPKYLRKEPYFFDSYHLNAEGADVFTSELTEDLRSIMNRRQNEPKDKR